jgi:hypothetical protein
VATTRMNIIEPANDIEFSGERKRVRCNEGLDGALPRGFGRGLVKPKCLRHGRAAR